MFRPVPLARACGGAVARISTSYPDLAAAFGEPHDDACEPEKGYGPSYYFVDADGVCFGVYARWGCFRVSGPTGPKLAAFVTWLGSELSAELDARDFNVDRDIRMHVEIDALFSKEGA